MFETDLQALGLALLWLWGLSIASVLRWWSRRLNNWLKPDGSSQKKKRKKKRSESGTQIGNYWD